MYEELSQKQKRELSAQFLRAQFLGSETFVKNKLGSDGLKEMNNYMAKESAKVILDSKFDELRGFGYYCKACAELAFCSDIELIEKNDEIIFIHKNCASLKELNTKNIERKSFCNWCMEFYRLVALELGLKFSSKLTEKGCEIRVK